MGGGVSAPGWHPHLPRVLFQVFTKGSAGWGPREPPAPLSAHPSLRSPSPQGRGASGAGTPQNRCLGGSSHLAQGSPSEAVGAKRGAGRGLSGAEGGRWGRALTQRRRPAGRTWAPGGQDVGTRVAPGLGERSGRERPALLKGVWGTPLICSPGRCHPRGAPGAERPPSPHHPDPSPPEPRGTCESPHGRRPRLAVHHRPHDEDGEAGHGAEAGVGGAEAELPARRGHGRRAAGGGRRREGELSLRESQVQGRERSPSRGAPAPPPPRLRPAPPRAAARTAPSLAGGRRRRGPAELAPEVLRGLGFLVSGGDLFKGQIPGLCSDPPCQGTWALVGSTIHVYRCQLR